MKTHVSVHIDPQDVFDKLASYKNKSFLFNNSLIFYYNELIDKSYKDSEQRRREYERVSRCVESILEEEKKTMTQINV